MKKHPVSLLIGGIIAALMLFFLFDFLSSKLNEAETMETAESIGTMLGLTYMLPFRALLIGGTLFCWLAYLFSMRWAAIVAGVLFAVAIVVLPGWLYLPIVPMILCFVGAAKLKPSAMKENSYAAPQETSPETKS